MVPSSIQWTMAPPVHILVYPISKYVISPVIKSPKTIVNHRVQRQTATTSRSSKIVSRCSESRFRRRFPYKYGYCQYWRSQKHRHMQMHLSKRSPYRSKKSPCASKRCPYHRENDCSRSQCDKRCGSRDTCNSGVRSTIQRRDKQAPPHDRKQEQDEDMNLDVVMQSEEDEDEDDEELEVELEDCDYNSDNDNIYDDDDYHDGDDDKVNKDENSKDEHEEQLEFQWPGAQEYEYRRSDYVDDTTITCSLEPRLPVSELNNRVMRCSANVVLLAHGNRSLYVLTIQRNQVTSVVSTSVRHKNQRSSSNTVISYKLPGGKFILTDDEQHSYHRDGRNTCTCPDDQKWYSAAISHFMTQLTTRGLTTSTTTSMMTTATGQAIEDQPQFIPLGNWYRTQQDDDYKVILAAGGAKYDQHNHSNSNYYPYKPAHVSRKLAGHKRVYAVPDACHLFPGAENTFQLQAPCPKTKTTTTNTKTSTVTITTTYKCKFVPLARLHENSRLYGPVLSSLPAVLSSMNLVFSP